MCTLKHCSIACYKTPKPIYANDEATPGETQVRAERGKPKIDFIGFESTSELRKTAAARVGVALSAENAMASGVRACA